MRVIPAGPRGLIELIKLKVARTTSLRKFISEILDILFLRGEIQSSAPPDAQFEALNENVTPGIDRRSHGVAGMFEHHWIPFYHHSRLQCDCLLHQECARVEGD